MIAFLFDVSVPRINEHIKNIYDSCYITRDATIRKFRIVQNKLHFVIHEHTAEELIIGRVNSSKEHMCLTTWEKSQN